MEGDKKEKRPGLAKNQSQQGNAEADEQNHETGDDNRGTEKDKEMLFAAHCNQYGTS